MILKKLWNATFERHRLSTEEKDFITENKKQWVGSEDEIGIIIEGFLRSPTSVIEKARIAKAIEAGSNVRALVLLRGFTRASSDVYDIYKSFAIKEFVMWWAQYFNILLFVKVFIKTTNIFLRCRHTERLLELKFDDIIIGDLIYDTLIRFNPQSYTVDRLKVTKHFRHIFRSYYSAELYKKLFEKYTIKAIVTSHNVYAEYGVLCRLGYKYGADIYLKDMDVFKHYDHTIDIKEHFLKVNEVSFLSALDDHEILIKAEKYLEDRFDGTADQIDVKNAYRNKHTYSKIELFDHFNIEEDSKKNVFILAHAFSDAPHVGEGLLFKDYYTWLVETLKIISTVQGVNIFVKPHPSSYMWNENGAVEEILLRLGLQDIHILPNDLNTNSIKDIADYILTAQGTAGLEFSCFGIPAITAGKGYYSGFGVSIEPETKEIYEQTIKDILKIEALSDEKKKKAKIILYLSFQHLVHSAILPNEHILPGEESDLKAIRQYQEVADKLKQGVDMKDEFYYRIYNDAKRKQ